MAERTDEETGISHFENENIHNFTASLEDPLISSIETYDGNDITTSQDTDSNEGL